MPFNSVVKFPLGIFHALALGAALTLLTGCAGKQTGGESPALAPAPAAKRQQAMLPSLDLRAPMALAARAIPARLDPQQDYRPWFLLRGSNGIPVHPEHASWDLGDMTGRYLEGLILARRMGVSAPELSQAEGRLQRYLFKLLGPDGLVHDPASGAVDHTFSQGSALYGLLALFEDSGDPAVRLAIDRLIAGELQRVERRGDWLVDISVRLPEASGSHLAGYQIYPLIRFYELTGCADALKLSEGFTGWAIADPVLDPNGEIRKPLSWEGHIHSWLDTLAGCVRTARNSSALDRPAILARCRAVYDWVRRTNGTSFGWFATYPTGGSCETCAISSAIRLALELAASGFPEYYDDVERFVRNQVVEAQFKDLKAYGSGAFSPTPLLLGCFDSQSMPNGHLGTRGGEDVGTVEGCCLNGGMRALALAWEAIQTADEKGVTVNLGLTRSGPAADVIGYQPFEGRVDVIPRVQGQVRIRVPGWVSRDKVSALAGNRPCTWRFESGYVVLDAAKAGERISVRYPLREVTEQVTAGGQRFRVRWKGDVVVAVDPPGQREPTYRGRLAGRDAGAPSVPNTYELQDAVRLAAMSMLARLDLERGGQPFFALFPFATPPRAEHGKWDDGDTTGRYVEALILARRLTGIPLDSRETLLRQYLAGLFDPNDGLCYTRQASWTPRRACLFSQSSAMLGLLAWYRETGAPEARQLLDRQVDGLLRLAPDLGSYVYFPKYEFDGQHFVNEPPDKDAPIWYGGRLILPLVEYWQLSGREDVKQFIEKLIRFSVEVSHFIQSDGAVERGEGWWGHLHSTMDMAAGIAEYGRLANRPGLVVWAQRVYDWIGRTHTTRNGWVADVSGGHICESCAIASRIRLGLALYRASVTDPFGEIDRHVRNQLFENQFVDTSFMAPAKPETPRQEQMVYAGVDQMICGTFQCWATANDRIGHDDIEGCGAGGGVQGLALAWNAMAEWRKTPQGRELRVHLLFNRRLRAQAEAPFVTAAPVAAELWSSLPYAGRVVVRAHQAIDRLALRLPDGVEPTAARVRRSTPAQNTDSRRVSNSESPALLEGPYAILPRVLPGEEVQLLFPLKEYETTERAAGVDYRVRWRGSAVVSLEPRGAKAPLFANRTAIQHGIPPRCAPRYP